MDFRTIEVWLIAQVAERSGLSTKDIDPEAALVEFGFSSADAVAFSGDLEKQYRIPVSPTVFWEHPSIRAVAEHLAATSASAAPPPEPVRANPFDQLLKTVETSKE